MGDTALDNMIDNMSMLENVIETSYDGIYITDGNAKTIMINKSYERITGLNREVLMGKNMSELVEKHIISESATLAVLKNKKVVTLHQQFNSGKCALVTGTPFFDKEKNIKMVVTNVRDITDLQKLREKISESQSQNEKYKVLIEELNKQITGNECIIAEDEEMLNLLLLAKRVAKVDTTVMIYGETGAGKEIVAKYIYNKSLRKNKPYIKVNCGAIPENLMESEFFGYTDGAFTGALKGGKIGIFESANTGTLLLDEIGELPISMQVKLLRVLQEGEIEKIGSNSMIKVDVRIIASTNRDLEQMVKQGTFREDLYYRLNVVPLKVLPLRERKSSILPLVQSFLELFNKKYGMNKEISKDAFRYLYEYSWPGNVRELKNLLERVIVTSPDDVITSKDLPLHIFENSFSGASHEGRTLSSAVARVEKEIILNAYEKHKNVRKAAEELGIDPSTFVRKRKKYI